MIGRWVLLCLLVFSMGMGAVTAQESDPPPDYAMVFRAGNTLMLADYSADGWQVETLPFFMLFGQYDISLIVPQWSADGQLIGVGYDPELEFENEPAYEAPASTFYRYDARQQSLDVTPGQVEIPADELYMPLTLRVNSISPHGRYITVHDLTRRVGYLIDLETDEVLYTGETCGITALGWSEAVVYLGSYASYINCDLDFAVFNLETRTTEASSAAWEAALIEAGIAQFAEGDLLGNDDLLAVAYDLDVNSYLYRINATGVNLVAQDIGYEEQVILSADRQAAAFTRDNKQIYLDLGTNQQHEVGATREWMPAFFADQTLHWGSIETTDNGIQLIHRWYAPGVIDEARVLYEGAEPEYYAFAPSLEFVAVNDGAVVRIYGEAGLVWESTAPERMTWLAWDGDWLRITAEGVNTISVNPATGSVIVPPEPYSTYVSTSPDGQWWLYFIREPLDDQTMYRSERLYVYHPESGEIVLLADGEPIYDNFHFPLDVYFIWSPLLTE